MPPRLSVRPSGALALAGLVLVLVGSAVTWWLWRGQRLREPVEPPVYRTPSSFCLEFASHSFAQQVRGVAGSPRDLRPGVADGVARFLRRTSRAGGTPEDLQARLVHLAEELVLSARSGDFDEPIRLGAELDARIRCS